MLRVVRFDFVLYLCASIDILSKFGFARRLSSSALYTSIINWEVQSPSSSKGIIYCCPIVFVILIYLSIKCVVATYVIECLHNLLKSVEVNPNLKGGCFMVVIGLVLWFYMYFFGLLNKVTVSWYGACLLYLGLGIGYVACFATALFVFLFTPMSLSLAGTYSFCVMLEDDVSVAILGLSSFGNSLLYSSIFLGGDWLLLCLMMVQANEVGH